MAHFAKILLIYCVRNYNFIRIIIYRFELVVTIQGTSSTTSQYSKTITSYMNSEILWGQRYKQCIMYDDDLSSYLIDHKQFNKTEEVLTPLCSAQHLQNILMDVESYNNINASYGINNNPIIELMSNKNINDETMLNVDVHIINNNMKKNDNDDDGHEEEKPINDIYIFLNEMKKKIDDNKTSKPRCSSNTQNPRRKNNEIIDVEYLLENLQKYVDDNLNN